MLTLCRDSDRIPTTEKTARRRTPEKRNGGMKMLSTKGYLATMKEWEKESREKAAASIAERLIAAGIF